MKISKILVCLLLLLFVWSSGAVAKNSKKEKKMEQGNTKSVMAALDVMGYGYEVKVHINGVDLELKGGKSESLRLFETNHPMASKLQGAMKKLACLKLGENEIMVEYKRLEGQGTTGLTIQITTAQSMEKTKGPLLEIRKDDQSGMIKEKFNL